MNKLTKKELKLQKRNIIMELQNSISELVDGKDIVQGDSEIFPLKHTFTDGVYIRQMSMHKGSAVIGKIHRHNHVWFLLTGHIFVVDENNSIEHIAPCYVEAKSGSKRIIYAYEDSVWVNVHANPSNTQDLQELEDLIIAKDYDEFNNKK
tara:strand:+ start:165 stop:614 length:450 start_codon:yes stop_codon:yes gene_type:complete